ncbi:hypothetical protein J2T02_005139 [Chitinophaga terrae (ex Kim and Jung 2007)]|uniref:DUF3800 domain-containing protein n=1 Tax=Chitinophaga terrae (ex Kim and Jung 2007) TaxID=408074 RepID=UPI00277FB98B|nr:DUF3800 domain-containing protein [Chitinophaga terrae (ex Kim and Jung 2007)]MDQ0109992.1 hypothetical protein [Chitinophaga terrae (ex Kim and Jung 2007)]
MKNNLLAFADEYGNNSFDFSTQGSHFIVASVIIEENDLNTFEENVEAIRKKYFQKGEIKSSSVGSNNRRREIILKELVKLNFSIYALSADKEKLFGDGLKYKQSFYKFINGLLYKELYQAYPNLKLYVDQHGGNDFLNSFKKYVHKNHINDLFSGSEFEMRDSKNSIIIQVADFIAGTLGHCFDRSKDLSCKDKFLDILAPKLSGIATFPRTSREYKVTMTNLNDFDRTISQYSTNLAIDFIDTVNLKGQNEVDQLNFIKLLLLNQEAFSGKKYLTSKEIIKHLKVGRNKPLHDQQLRTAVIGKLRDKGLLIASNSKGDKHGYRLPTNANDLIKFIEHGNSLLLPMLNRIKTCRQRVKLATNNMFDILENTGFNELKKLIDAIE